MSLVQPDVLSKARSVVPLIVEDGFRGSSRLISILPAVHRDNEVHHGSVVQIWVQMDIMPGRDKVAVQFEPHAPVLS